MTDEERKKRIHDITYSTDDREELAERIVKLEDENDWLRAERDYLWMNANPTAYELRTVRAQWKKDRDENAKLRELVRYMFQSAAHSVWHDGEPDLTDFADRMRELGIEVEE